MTENPNSRADQTRGWALDVLRGDAGFCRLDDATGPEFIGLALIYVGDVIREAVRQSSAPVTMRQLIDAAPTAEASALLSKLAQVDDWAGSEQQ